MLDLRDPGRVARKYVRLHPAYTQCRVDGHCWTLVSKTARPEAFDLEAGEDIGYTCQRCKATKVIVLGCGGRQVRLPRRTYPEGWDAYAIGSVPEDALRQAYYETIVEPVEADATP